MPRGVELLPADPGQTRPGTLPVQQVGVLGDYDFCRACAGRVGLPGPVGVLYAAARWIVAAHRWVCDLEQQATGMDWLDVARWSAHTPFGPPDPIAALLARLAGARGFARHRLATQGVWATLQQRADVAFATARQAARPPGWRVRAARARDLLATDPAARDQAHTIEAIGGVNRRDIWRRDLFTDALDAWLSAVAADGDSPTAHAAMLGVVEARYGQAVVRDVSLLPDPALTPPGGHPGPAAWAAVEYAAIRRQIVAGWCTALTTLLEDPAQPDGQRLLLVAGWPVVSERDRELAYLTQYPVLDRAVITGRDPTGFPPPAQVPWVVVLRVPAFAAEHAAAHRDGDLHATAGPTIPAGADPDPRQVRELLRRAAGFLTADTTTDPAVLDQVTLWRAQAGPTIDLRAWASGGGWAFDLPYRWRLTPSPTAGLDSASGTEILTQLCEALHKQHHPVALRLAAGEPDQLTPVDLIVYPGPFDHSRRELTYQAHDLPGCPQVTVPLRRIISLSDAR